MKCLISDWCCIYHACMSDDCQKAVVLEQNIDWGEGNCKKIKTMEHPILFSTPMVREILAGRKTMTRRIFKGGARLASPEAFKTIDFKQWFIDYHDMMMSWCRYGKTGDILWVRETWGRKNIWIPGTEGFGKIVFKADNNEGPYDGKWKPGIHMPRAAARLFLQVKEISIEKLKEIDLEDIKKEGFVGFPEFKKGWIEINGQENLDQDPWVWVIEFEKNNDSH